MNLDSAESLVCGSDAVLIEAKLVGWKEGGVNQDGLYCLPGLFGCLENLIIADLPQPVLEDAGYTQPVWYALQTSQPVDRVA